MEGAEASDEADEGTTVDRGAAPSEDDLVRRYREGDGEALCRLFDRYEGLLRARIAHRLPKRLLRRVAVSDVLQESRVAALDRHRDFEPRGRNAFRNWALGIVDMRARKVIERHDGAAKRAAGREVTRTHRRATGDFVADAASASEVAMAGELRSLLQEAVAQLPPDYREVLRLTREEGLDLAAASERMGRSRDAVKKLSGRALARLARVLRELEDGAGGP